MESASHDSLTSMNFPPIVAPRTPNSFPQSMPSGVAYGAPIAVAGAVATNALSCPPGLNCGNTQEMEQLRDATPSATFSLATTPTWVKVVAGLSLAALVVLLVVKIARR